MSGNTPPSVHVDMASGSSNDHASANIKDTQMSPSLPWSAVPHLPHLQTPFPLAASPPTNSILQPGIQHSPVASDTSQFFPNTSTFGFDALPAYSDYLPWTIQNSPQADMPQYTFNGFSPLDVSTQVAQWGNAGMESWPEFPFSSPSQDSSQTDMFQPAFDNILPVFDRMQTTQWQPGSGNWQDFRVNSTFNSLTGADPTGTGPIGTGSNFPTRPCSRASSYGSADSGVSHPPRAKRGVKKVVKMKYSDFANQSTQRVGRRKGPLRPKQREQASEVRKLRACLRCKFLKKTCDRLSPCAGCTPSHARLWQIPCTRLDIKDLAFFMKDWKADYERHIDNGSFIYNIKGFSTTETPMWVTHGYGFSFPIMVREVFLKDDSNLRAEWVEMSLIDQEPLDFKAHSEKLSVGVQGVCLDAISKYLDQHIDGPFEDFIDKRFEDIPFVTEMLKTAYRLYDKSRIPVLRKALKLLLAYNLTMTFTMMDKSHLDGVMKNVDSKLHGRIVAPIMVNFQIKQALADVWRELQKDILEELSYLFSHVYSGEKLKNWPTIFMLSLILLVVWEEMQFVCHSRVPDPETVDKFCLEMETTSVAVIVGLFRAISTKLPDFTDWDTCRHGHILLDTAVCEAMTEIRQHVIKYEAYLRTRQEAKFDRGDFSSLSNKFLCKLVLRNK